MPILLVCVATLTHLQTALPNGTSGNAERITILIIPFFYFGKKYIITTLEQLMKDCLLVGVPTPGGVLFKMELEI